MIPTLCLHALKAEASSEAQLAIRCGEQQRAGYIRGATAQLLNLPGRRGIFSEPCDRLSVLEEAREYERR